MTQGPSNMMHFDLNRFNWVGWMLFMLSIGVAIGVCALAATFLGDEIQTRSNNFGFRKIIGIVGFGVPVAFFFGCRLVLNAMGVSIYRPKDSQPKASRPINHWWWISIFVIIPVSGVLLLAALGITLTKQASDHKKSVFETYFNSSFDKVAMTDYTELAGARRTITRVSFTANAPIEVKNAQSYKQINLKKDKSELSQRLGKRVCGLQHV